MNLSSPQVFSSPELEDDINLTEYFDIFLDHRWLVAFVCFISLFVGTAYSILATPIFESNLVIQVEDSEKSAGSFLGDAASSLFSVKTPAAGEIEILKSRRILGAAVEDTKLYIDSTPRYFPVVGRWLARRSSELSDPGAFGLKGRVYGTEKIIVVQFDVPTKYESTPFTLTVTGDKTFLLTHPDLDESFKGTVGDLLIAHVAEGEIRLRVRDLFGKTGAEFRIIRNSKQLTLDSLQDNIKVVEKGKQSGVLDVRLRSSDPVRLSELLNEIGHIYVRQNIERKAAEAEKTLGFLDSELPKLKLQLDQSEDVYNKYRNVNGTVSLDDEAKNALAQSVDLQSRLIDAQQKRRDLASRFTDKHPAIQTLDAQIAAWNSEISSTESRIKKMPMLQQSAVRMQRDIKVNTDLYVSLLNSSMQMRLAKEGKVGNVRLVDEAVVSEESINLKRPIVIFVSACFGFIFGCILAILRNTIFGGVRNPAEIEAATGLNVYSTIPLSPTQKLMDKDVENRAAGTHVLALTNPDDPAIESLRSLRTSLQFTMLEARNNVILISGATPGVGKSFVSVNFATIFAASGKKVVLVDADLRKGHINQVFSLGRAAGLSELIAGGKSLNDVLRREVVPNLDLVTTGALPPNPAELLLSESFTNIVKNLSANYDIVLIDTPPVLVASDTAAVAAQAGTILLVARAEKTQLGELNESLKRLAHSGASANGVVLNAMDMTRRHYGSYGYKYGGYRYTQYKYKTDKSGD